MIRVGLAAAALVLAAAPAVRAQQQVSERGFVEGKGTAFFEEAANDPQRLVGDLLAREEVFLRPTPWFQLAAGADFRANSHDQVEDEWRFDVDDRSVLRPRIALRRLSATFTTGGFTLDLGKQFIRWGRADVIYPTDRFAPRDYLNVLDADVLPVIAARPSLQVGNETFEAIATLQPTPSRLPLINQRWAPLPEPVRALPVVDGGSDLPDRGQYRCEMAAYRAATGDCRRVLRWNQPPSQHPIEGPGGRQPRVDPGLPTGTHARSGRRNSHQLGDLEDGDCIRDRAHRRDGGYALYVIEVERQTGEWLLDFGTPATSRRSRFRCRRSRRTEAWHGRSSVVRPYGRSAARYRPRGCRTPER